MSYSAADIKAAYRAVGVEAGRVVYLTSDLSRLMEFEKPGKEAVLAAHMNALLELLGPAGTLMVSAASLNICNTDAPFDHDNTPSYQVGVFSEYVRTRAQTLRSFHPFVSYAAQGHDANLLTRDCARHPYGPETPEARAIEADALSVSVGLPPNVTCSTIHHVEQMVGVPYRYAKEFKHPVLRGGVPQRELFYMYVWYQGIGIRRDRTRKIFAALNGVLPIAQAGLGRGQISAYSMAAFYALATPLLSYDPYIWCEEPPTEHPYRS
jgi:aminoglycoside 3-N-acetyltransferase